MQDRENLTAADEELTEALGSLRPMRASGDRDRLMFRAGQVSVRRGRRVWQGLTVLATVALCVSLLVHSQGPESGKTVRVIAENPPVAPLMIEWSSEPFVVGDGAYLKLRNEVLEKGIDALPEPAVSVANGEDQDWRELLGRPMDRKNKRTSLLRSLFYTGDGT